MSRAPHVRVIALLGLMAIFSAGCTPAVPSDPTPSLQTPAVVAATDAPISPAATLAPEQPPTIQLPTLAAPTAIVETLTPIDATIVAPTVLPTPTLTLSPEPTIAATAPAASSNVAGDALESGLIKRINQSRTAAGCNIPLTRSPALTAAARRHSQDMATHSFLGHTGSDGSSRASRAQDAGYIGRGGTRVRENIAMFADPADVMSNWTQNSITSSQMLDCTYNDIGIGYAKINNGQSTTYWTALFGVRP